MIIDWLVAAGSVVITPILNLLPHGHLTLPGATGLADLLGGLDSMVPILAPIQLGLTVLGAVVVFMAVRFILVIWNLIWP